MNTLILAWLVAAMASWVPQPAADAGVSAHRDAVARDIATVAYDPAEAPLYRGDDGRARTAVLLAAVASLESQYRPDVDAGVCRPHECDHGRAYCMMQVQPGPNGIVLTDDGEWTYAERVPGVDPARVVRGADLVRDRQLCVRAALHMVRASLRHVRTLGEYTGEGRDGPKARHRLERAARWYRAHPVPIVTPEG